MLGLQFSDLWQAMSTEFIDAAVKFRPIRKWALKQGEKQLYETYVVNNVDGLPLKVQELRCLALTNLLHAVDKALVDGRISPQVRRGVIKNFIGNLLIGVKKRSQPFKEKYGFYPPVFLTISPTKRCNLQCTGCYAGSTASDKNTLPYSILNRIIADKRENWGSHFTVISGGEPLMYRNDGKDIFDLFKENNDNYFLMYTNATLINKEAARKLAELGNVTPAISVEGWEKETDERRGKGVFRKIQEAMDNLKSYGVPYGISVTATRKNAEIVLTDEFMDYYFNEKGVIYGWIFQYMPIGRSYTVDLMITPEQRQWMLEKELELIYNKRIFLIDFWNGGPLSIGCLSAGRSGGYFYIDWNGNVAHCVFFPYHVANIKEVYESGGDLTTVLMSGYFKKIRDWQDKYLNKHGKVGNLFAPCPIRDHHEVAYETIIEFNAKPMDDDAAQAIKDEEYHKKMYEYNAKTNRLLGRIWEREVYAGGDGNGDKRKTEEKEKEVIEFGR
ncbi:MAG: radical SAM protein [Spirochaetes bacterium]|nr:MAG: radical SAM protein [Spirochaetota bacterium]